MLTSVLERAEDGSPHEDITSVHVWASYLFLLQSFFVLRPDKANTS